MTCNIFMANKGGSFAANNIKSERRKVCVCVFVDLFHHIGTFKANYTEKEELFPDAPEGANVLYFPTFFFSLLSPFHITRSAGTVRKLSFRVHVLFKCSCYLHRMSVCHMQPICAAQSEPGSRL